IDECASSQNNDCHDVNGLCVNIDGGYTCQCKQGYTGDGRTCNDINECDDVGREMEEVARQNIDEYINECDDVGREMEEVARQNIDECASSQNNDCHDVNGLCVNNDGGYTCQCKQGYTGDGRTCNDVNECDDVHGCHAEATCQNTAGGYECHCNAGWTGDGRSCSGKDIFAKCLDFELLDMLIY
ncbi:fibrillin-2-like isoform X48, partial [Paramuricea clavata]